MNGYIVARTIYGEARNQPFEGMIAVAHVIFTRAKERNQTPEEVCLAPKQFSCWNVGDPNLEKIKSVGITSAAFCQCIVVADLVEKGELPDPTDGANHYYADYIKQPKWAKLMTVTTKIGDHIFLKG